MTNTAVDSGIPELKAGSLINLRLHNSKGDTEIETRFIGFAMENEYLRARFQEDGATFIWNARQYGDRWLYGINETEYVTVAKVLEPGRESYIFDKHLSKLNARRDSNAEGHGGQLQHPRARKRHTGTTRFSR